MNTIKGEQNTLTCKLREMIALENSTNKREHLPEQMRCIRDNTKVRRALLVVHRNK